MQHIIDTVLEVPVQQKHCSKCRVSSSSSAGVLKKCARCKVAHYCSKDCQKQHYSIHRSSCKRVAQLLQAKLLNDDTTTKVALADAIVEMTYRSCDTILSGAHGFACATRYYLEVLVSGGDEISSVDAAQANKAAFLLAALGHDEAALYVISYSNDVEGSAQEGEPQEGNPYDDFLPIVTNTSGDENTTHLVTLLFMKMKIVANSKVGADNFELFTSSPVGSTLTNVHDMIRKYLLGSDEFVAMQQAQMEALRSKIQELRPFLLYAIQECIPLTPHQAPSLFDLSSPAEFWCLLQDCFFLTPGVNQLLDKDEMDDE